MHILLSVSGVDDENVKSSFSIYIIFTSVFSPAQLDECKVRSNECSNYNSCYLLVIVRFCLAASEVVSVVVGAVVSSGVAVRMSTEG